MGPAGPMGLQGPSGKDGKDGRDGMAAPRAPWRLLVIRDPQTDLIADAYIIPIEESALP